MDPTTIIPTLRAGLDLIQRLEPIAALVPGAGGIANIAAGLAEIAEGALEDAAGVTAAMSSDDQAELKEILANLQARSDANYAALKQGR